MSVSSNRLRSWLRATPVITLALTVTAVATADGVSFESVAPGVTAVVQPRDNWVNDCNAVILVGRDAVAVVDAPSDPLTVRATIAEIERLTEVPVRYVVNTHWHSDHTQGNQLYRRHYGAGLTILGHDTLRLDVPERAGAYIDEQRQSLAEIIPRAEEQLEQGLSLGGEPLDAARRERQRAGIDDAKARLAVYEGVEMLPPDLTYDTRFTLHLGGLEVRLRHFRAHTDGDTVVYLPAERVLVSGDLLDVMPFAGHGHLESWIATLDELAGLEIDRIVPGHGPVFEGKAQLELLRDYFQAVVDGARTALARGETAEQAQESVDLSRFRQSLAGDDPALQRSFDAFAPEAVARAWAELAAASPDAGE